MQRDKTQNGTSTQLTSQVINVHLVLLFCIALPLLLSQCRRASDPTITRLSPNHTFALLDSTQAAEAIVLDSMTAFFQVIRPLDMNLQMKQTPTDEKNSTQLLTAYRNYLKTDVEHFTKVELKKMNTVMQRAYELCTPINPSLFPTHVQLIKTKGQHYGPSTFYTRNSNIIIPADELRNASEQSLLEVMLHELAHIYTRYHPRQANRLYQLIGFRALDKPLRFPLSLNERLLLNPDGVNTSYAITLHDEAATFEVVPIIYSIESAYKPSRQHFINYLKLDFYKIVSEKEHYLVQANELAPTIDWENNFSFHQQITNNTDYIIHPDEIIADNIMYCILDWKDDGYGRRFSDDGLQLLQDIKAILKSEELN